MLSCCCRRFRCLPSGLLSMLVLLLLPAVCLHLVAPQVCEGQGLALRGVSGRRHVPHAEAESG